MHDEDVCGVLGIGRMERKSLERIQSVEVVSSPSYTVNELIDRQIFDSIISMHVVIHLD